MKILNKWMLIQGACTFISVNMYVAVEGHGSMFTLDHALLKNFRRKNSKLVQSFFAPVAVELCSTFDKMIQNFLHACTLVIHNLASCYLCM